MKIVEQYLAYWRLYIQPLADKEPNRYVHFTDTLNAVGRRFYGPPFSLEFNVAILQVLEHVPAGQASDNT